MLERKYNLNTRYYYSTLNRNEKKLYRIMAENLLNRKYEFEYDIPWKNLNFIKVHDAIRNDFPELFYIDNNPICWGEKGVIKVLNKIYYNDNEILKLNARLEEILHKFDNITDPFELQEAVTEFICREYTYSLDERGPKTRQERHNVVGLLKRKKGVCSAFSKLAQFIFQRRGIPVAYIGAETTDESVPDEENAHAWLAVKHGDSYYHWDITAILSEASDEETTQYTSFNITDKEIIDKGYKYDPAKFNGLTCNKTDYEYYHHKGLYFESYEQIRQAAVKFVSQLDYTKEVNWFNFRVSPEIDSDEALEYVPTGEDVKKRLDGTEYIFAKFNSFFYRDGQGYFRCKIATKRKRKMKLTIVQPNYHRDESPCERIREFLKAQLSSLEENEIIVLPEYSNAGGTSDPEVERASMKFASEMKSACSRAAKTHSAYVAVNVLEEREGKIKNSTYLYGKNGKLAFIYDKIHLPPAERELGIERGDGACTCVLDGIRFAFMTCYDVYYSEQIEHIAKFKPDVIIVPGYQRGEQVDIIKAQATLLAYRCNAFVLRSSYSMGKDHLGGCSMIVTPLGKTVACLGKDEGCASFNADDIKSKCYRPAGFGQPFVLNDEFINQGLCPEAFQNDKK